MRFGVLRASRPPRPEVIDEVVALTATELVHEATHCTPSAMAGQIPRLDRVQSELPLKKTPVATMDHGLKRNGTTILLRAFNVLDGMVTGRSIQRHGHQP